MVHGTFATNFIRENFRNMCHLWQRDGTRTWFIGLTYVPCAVSRRRRGWPAVSTRWRRNRTQLYALFCRRGLTPWSRTDSSGGPGWVWRGFGGRVPLRVFSRRRRRRRHVMRMARVNHAHFLLWWRRAVATWSLAVARSCSLTVLH